MNVSYGPPGHKGVTTLMAVGADELEQTTTDRAVTKVAWLSAGVWLIGALTGNRGLSRAGMGATIALVGVRWTAGALGKQVPVTTAPATAIAPSGW